MSNEQEKRDNENYAKNFTRVCNIVLDSYKHLTYEEKFLYIKMREVYWDAKPRFASLRDISRLTGYAISALSRILPRLHKCGLIHAEIKQEFNPDGTKKGKPKYYITIPDIWELNRKYYECSPEERFDPSDVLLENDNVLQKNVNVLLENDNVLQKNVVVPPEERFCPTQNASQARSQRSKDKKDIIKIESKIEGASQQDVLTHSSTPSSFSHDQVTLSPEEQRIHGYWQKLDFEDPITPKLKEHWGKLVKSVQSFEQFKSLYDHTKRSLKGAKDETVYPGNMVKCLTGWKQSQQDLAQPEKPKTKQKITKEYLEMVGY